MPAETPKHDKDCFPFYVIHDSSVAFFDIGHSSFSDIQSYIAWHANTGVDKKSSMDNNAYRNNMFNNNRQFIQLEQSFIQQMNQNPEIFAGQNTFILKEKMRISSDAILNFSPDKVSLQLTEEGNIFYTFFKDGLTIYLQHFLIDEYDGSDEAIVNIFNGHENLLNFGGSLIDSAIMISQYLSPKSIKVLEFA